MQKPLAEKLQGKSHLPPAKVSPQCFLLSNGERVVELPSQWWEFIIIPLTRDYTALQVGDTISCVSAWVPHEGHNLIHDKFTPKLWNLQLVWLLAVTYNPLEVEEQVINHHKETTGQSLDLARSIRQFPSLL